jgi:transposase-like protein
VRHPTNQYVTNRIEQDHRGIKVRYQPMRGFEGKSSHKATANATHPLENRWQRCLALGWWDSVC